VFFLRKRNEVIRYKKQTRRMKNEESRARSYPAILIENKLKEKRYKGENKQEECRMKKVERSIKSDFMT